LLRATFIAMLATLLTVGMRISHACTTPVYQYALQQWEPANYRLNVRHSDPPGPDQEALLEAVRRRCADQRAPANVEAAFEPVVGAGGRPSLSLCYPATPEGGAAFLTVPLTAETAERLFDSPARRELARRLRGGQACVWVFVESGNRAPDDAAAALLASEIERLQGALERSGPEAGVADAATFRPSFSVLRVSRTDPAEEAFISMLTHSEADLAGLANQPMAFPVFGRGRVLYAVVGRGINPRIIEDACRFVTGPCACEIKDENPGTDLLMAVNWDAADAAAPVLTGVLPEPPAATAVSAAPAAGTAAPPAPAPALQGGALLRNSALALAAVAALAGIGLVVLRVRLRRAGRNRA